MAESRYVPLREVSRVSDFQDHSNIVPVSETTSLAHASNDYNLSPDASLVAHAAAPGVAPRNSYTRQDSHSATSPAERIPVVPREPSTGSHWSGATGYDYQRVHSPEATDDFGRGRPGPHPRWSSRSLQSMLALKHNVRYSMTPSMHDMDDRDKIGTARRFNYGRQARRLCLLVSGEALLSCVFCAIYIVILKVYEHKGSLNADGRHVFNTLITGISLFIGINLTASLRSYAKLLRWRLLTYSYRPLREFDLMLGCDSLTNVVRLMFLTRNSRYRFLPSRTHLVGLVWLAINLAVMLFVGVVSLNFSLDAVAYTDFTQPGPANMIDLDSLSSGSYSYDLNILNGYGMSSINNQGVNGTAGLDYKYANATNNDCTSLSNGTTQFFLTLRDLKMSMSTRSHLHIRSDVSCNPFKVVDGTTGKGSWFTYEDSNGRHRVTYPTAPVGPAGLLFMADTNSSCGETCVNINAYQAGNIPGSRNTSAVGFTDAWYFECTSTLTYILDKNEKVYQGSVLTDAASNGSFQPAAETLRMLAGSIGWSDYQKNGTSWLYHAYGPGSIVGWEPTSLTAPNATEMQDMISTFVIGTVYVAASGTQSGLTFHEVEVDEAPVAAQALNVSNWKDVYLILVGIPLIHVITIVIVILVANDALIKDFSYLAISKLYWTLLEEKGMAKKGCMLSGEELVETMDNPRVRYGWMETDESDKQGIMIGHVDIFVQGRQYPRDVEVHFRRNVFYDGAVKIDRFDARDWF